MTKTENQTCGYCSTTPAIGIKTEVEREWTDANGGREVQVEVRKPICGGCEAHWFDGTEMYPELLPLP